MKLKINKLTQLKQWILSIVMVSLPSPQVNDAMIENNKKYLQKLNTFMENYKKELFLKTLKLKKEELVPTTILKSELIFLNTENFKLLYEHLGNSEYRMKEHGYDTIKIANVIFKRN
jgi:hypothetical protein